MKLSKKLTELKEEEDKPKTKLKRIKLITEDNEKIKIIADLYLAFYTKPQIKNRVYISGFLYPFFIDEKHKKNQQKLHIFQVKRGLTAGQEYERLYFAAKQYIITNLTKKNKTLMRAEMYNLLTNKLNEAFITNNNQLCLDCVKQIRQLNGLDLETHEEDTNKQNIVNNITIDLDKVHDYLEYCYTKNKDNKENDNISNNNEPISNNNISINLLNNTNNE